MPAEHKKTTATSSTVKGLVAVGYTQDKLAALLAIDLKTLRKHYRKELDETLPDMNRKVAASMYAIAIDDVKHGKKRVRVKTADQVRAGAYWLSCRAGWKTMSAVEHTGKDGGPIVHTEVPPDVYQEALKRALDDV